MIFSNDGKFKNLSILCLDNLILFSSSFVDIKTGRLLAETLKKWYKMKNRNNINVFFWWAFLNNWLVKYIGLKKINTSSKIKAVGIVESRDWSHCQILPIKFRKENLWRFFGTYFWKKIALLNSLTLSVRLYPIFSPSFNLRGVPLGFLIQSPGALGLSSD
jgi:hypothetical protein